MNRGAVIDYTGRHRYALWRVWDANLPVVLFIMLNPSTADANVDDPTIRRCMGFARDWGFGAIEVRNLFSFRATNPDELKRCDEPNGPENDRHIIEAAEVATKIVLAWGTKGTFMSRNQDVFKLIAHHRPECLGLSAAGHPKHPLYIPASQKPILYQGEGIA